MGQMDGKVAIVTDLVALVDGEGERANTAIDALEEPIRADGGRAIATYGDIGDGDAGTRIFEPAAAESGKVDILVDNVGALRKGRLTDVSEDDSDAPVHVQLRGISWLASPAAAYPTGQIFEAFGGTIRRGLPRRYGEKIEQHQRWTAELGSATATEVSATRPAGLPDPSRIQGGPRDQEGKGAFGWSCL